LDGFQNEKAAQAVERVLKKLSSTKAAEIIKVDIRRSSHPT
jgi:ribosomal protein L31